jgi:predicted metal-dependent peptidase
MVDAEAADKITKAKIAISHPITGNPFFGYMVFHLRTRENLHIPTMGVNAKFEMIYNPEFIKKTPDKELEFILCHEIMHLALEHTDKERQGSRTALTICSDGQIHSLWNIAGDYVINGMLEDAHIGQMPVDILLDSKYKEKLTEEVYDELFGTMTTRPNGGNGHSSGKGKGQGQPNGNGSGSGGETVCVPKRGNGNLGAPLHNETLEPAAKGNQPNGNGSGQQPPNPNDGSGGGTGNAPMPPTDWKQVMTEAFTNAKMQGKTPLGAERLMDKQNFPKKNWRGLLAQYIQKTIPYDSTYMRPNKRKTMGDIIFPSAKKDGITVVCGIDTSGSIGQEELKKFYNQMLGIQDSCQNMTMWVMTCDAEVHECQKIKRTDNILKKIKFRGGGGTELHKIFEKIKEKKLRPNAVAILTDGYTDLAEIKKQTYPVIWVLTPNHADMKNTYGKKIEIG